MKPRVIFRAPVLTASGYGVHSRQILRALILSKKYDLYVESIKWGETPFLTETDPFLDEVRRLASKSKQDVQFDMSIQVTIPPEFQKMAKVNIGVTAGIEVDRVSPGWISKANEMDLVIVPSKHSAQAYSVRYQTTNGDLFLTAPLAIVPEGVDTSIFDTSLGEAHLDFPSRFNFLCVGLGLDKSLGEDRKNISTLIKWFCERFKDDEDVGLVLKVGIVGASQMDYDATRSRIKKIKDALGVGQFPRIHLVHGRLSDESMSNLYRHPNVKAFISLTHGEGFGLPLLEAAACGLPILATDWSGHVDFLKIDDSRRYIPLEYDLTEIPASAVWQGVMEKGTRWASVKEEDVKHKMKKIVLSYDKPKEWALELAKHISENYSLEKTGNDFLNVLGSFAPSTSAPRTEKEFVDNILKQLGEERGNKTLLYTMPMSAGDVYMSTAVVNSLRKKFPEHRIYFATDEKYASILKGSTDIDRILKFDSWMMNVPLCEQIFDYVYTPNLAIQMNTSNWVRGGRGRLLAEEMAYHCDVDLGDYHIELEDVEGLPEKFVCFNPGPMKGQWESRSYASWQEVVNNTRDISGLPVVQVGQADDPAFEGVIDLRGKTSSYNQLAFVISQSSLMVGIDTATMHMAAGLGIPLVSIFGSSYSTSTGPAQSGNSFRPLQVLLDAPNRGGCQKACYKNQCSVDKDNPCLNEISPREIVLAILHVLGFESEAPDSLYAETYKEYRPKIAGYTHVLNADSQGFPYIESIKSMLGFCDEVIVVDGGSTDGTKEKIQAIGDARVKLIDHEWDWQEPGMDGMQKAYGRAMANVGPSDFLWQQDADEVVHEDDYQKIKDLVKRFPKDVDVMHLPVIELWGSEKRVRTDRHSWKWRLSRNNFRVTHGINKHARVMDEKTGRVHSKRGMSDGCEYIDVLTQEFLPHKGFYSRELEQLRISDPAAYGVEMNKIFSNLPSVFHYSWADLPRKIRNFRDFWDKMWSNLYNDPVPVKRFPTVVTDGDVLSKAAELFIQGGEHANSQTFDLERSNPVMMGEWLK